MPLSPGAFAAYQYSTSYLTVLRTIFLHLEYVRTVRTTYFRLLGTTVRYFLEVWYSTGTQD